MVENSRDIDTDGEFFLLECEIGKPRPFRAIGQSRAVELALEHARQSGIGQVVPPQEKDIYINGEEPEEELPLDDDEIIGRVNFVGRAGKGLETDNYLDFQRFQKLPAPHRRQGSGMERVLRVNARKNVRNYGELIVDLSYPVHQDIRRQIVRSLQPQSSSYSDSGGGEGSMSREL
jgi:hypothetical protein